MDGFASLIKERIEALRPKLQDTSRRNPLINNVLNAKSASFVRIVDEKPQSIYNDLVISDGGAMQLVPLPPTDIDPPDEDTHEFRNAFQSAQATDEKYLKIIEKIDFELDEKAIDKQEKADRDLKDRIREMLDMPPRPKSEQIADLVNHAKSHGINPSSSLPASDYVAEDDRHDDDLLQTLLLPKTFQSRMAKILSKARMYQEERGLDVVYIVFGYIKWTLPNTEKNDEFKSPLLLIPVSLNKQKSASGEIYTVSKLSEPIFNPSLAHKLKVEAKIDLKKIEEIFETESLDVEQFFIEFSELKPKNMLWNVLREASFGVYPFQGIELYYDLDTEFLDFENFPVVSELMVGKNASNDGVSESFNESDVDTAKASRLVPHLVLDADSSQFIALLKVANNENVALEGPPGSGKSQTIVNAIANAIYAGKRVLFVAQKVTALEVVFSRLQAIGLEQFILPMMGGYGGSEEFYDAVAHRLNQQPSFSSREISSLKSKYEAQRDKLSEYIDLLIKPVVNTGMTVHQVLGLAIANNEVIKKLPLALRSVNIFPQNYIEDFSPKDLEAVADKITDWKEKLIESELDNTSVWFNSNPSTINIDGINDALVSSRVALLELEQSIQSKDVEAQKIINEYFENDLKNIEYQLNQAINDENLRKINDLSKEIGILNLEKNIQLVANIDRELEELSLKNNLDVEIIKDIANLDNDLDKLVKTLSSLKIQRLDVDSVDRILSSVEKKTSSLELANNINDKIISLIGVSVSPKNLLAYQSFSEVKNEIDSLKDYLRVEGFQSALDELREARKYYKNGSKLLTTDVLPDPKTLKNLKDTIVNSGLFAFFSSKVKSAKLKSIDLLSELSSDSSKQSIVDALDDILTISKNIYDLNISEYIESFSKDFDKRSNAMLIAIDELITVNESTKLNEKHSLNLICYEEINEIFSLIKNLKLHDYTWEKISELSSRFSIRLNELKIDFDSLKNAQEFCYEHGIVNISDVEILSDTAKKSKNLQSARFESLDGLNQFFDIDTDFNLLSNSLSDYKNLSEVSIQLLLENKDSKILDYISRKIDTLSLISNSAMKLLSAKGVNIDDLNISSINNSIDLLNQHKNDQIGLNSIILHQSIVQDAENAGFGDVLKKIESNSGIPIRDLSRATIVSTFMDRIERDYGAKLLKFNGTSLSDARKQLQDLDRKIINLSPSEVKASALSKASPPPGVSYGRKSDYSDLALLKHELQKKRRTPPRKILKRAQGALLELFPCWMMVPTAVAQHLPRSGVFDLVIIDEASQMTPENSISALMRGKNVLIAGDTNQLPPTNFFKGLSSDEDEDEDVTTTEESILELANMQFHPKHRLLWHYRSKHEDLIAFSNHYVYDKELVIFPSPNPISEGMGISLVQVNGTFQRGINPAEAQVMLEAIVQFMKDTPERSLGVAVMNQSQMEQLESFVLREAETNKNVSNYLDYWNSEREGLEKFFVKNLENVQGDERDVIFVGTVYGRDPEGKFYQRFGPINGPAGKRRLNVLFSRAKEQIVTFSSIPLSDFNPSPTNEGATLLRRWLEFSATKRLGEVSHNHERAGYTDSPFEDHVIEAVNSLGFEAVPQVGVSSYFIDIGVKHPKYPFGYICGIECDGASYHSSKSARDRDRLREEVLNRLGWDLYRIWSTDWFRDALGCRELLKNYLNDRLAVLVENMPEVQEIENITEVDSLELAADSFTENIDNDGFTVTDVTEIELGSKFSIRYLDGPRAGVTSSFWLQKVTNDPGYQLDGYVTVGIDSPLGSAVEGFGKDDICKYSQGDIDVHVQIIEVE